MLGGKVEKPVKGIMGCRHCKWLLLLPILLFPFSAGHAASYKWTDRNGTLHYSDTPPAKDVQKSLLRLEDPEERPLLGKGQMVYQDRTFKILLADEQQDSLLFDVQYRDVQRAYPDAVTGNLRLLISAVDRSLTSTYLAYTVMPVQGGTRRFEMTNRMSGHSPQSLETDLLKILLYNDEDKQKVKVLLDTAIPFRKEWSKRDGVTYK